MTKEELNKKLFDNLTREQLILLNFNIFYNPDYIGYYIDYNSGFYDKCYDFIMNNLELLELKYTPSKFLKTVKKLI